MASNTLHRPSTPPHDPDRSPDRDPQHAPAVPLDPDRLVEANLQLVSRVVGGMAAGYPAHVDRDELWSAGATGLVDAAHRFDASAGVPFTAYATIRIRGAVLDSTRSRDWATRRVRREARMLDECEEQVWRNLGHLPSNDELASELDIDAHDVARIREDEQRATVLALEQPVSPSDTHDLTIVETLVDRTGDPEDALLDVESKRLLRAAVARLDGTLQEVVVRHFFDGERMKDIADDLGVTEGRVSQITREAIVALRAAVRDHFHGVPEHDDRAEPGRRRREAYVEEVSRLPWSEWFCTEADLGRSRVGPDAPSVR